MFRVGRYASSVLGLYDSSDRAKLIVSVFAVFDSYKVVNNTDEGHSCIYRVANGGVATDRRPAQQSLTSYCWHCSWSAKAWQSSRQHTTRLPLLAVQSLATPCTAPQWHWSLMSVMFSGRFVYCERLSISQCPVWKNASKIINPVVETLTMRVWSLCAWCSGRYRYQTTSWYFDSVTRAEPGRLQHPNVVKTVWNSIGFTLNVAGFWRFRQLASSRQNMGSADGTNWKCGSHTRRD